MKWGILIIFVFLIIVPTVLAKENHMTLLAVKDTPDGLIGSTADLYLDIVPGKGRVFIESYPLTKLDTQISTRFAKEIACDFADMGCDNYDFFYTLKSDSPIIGGPSAGAAISVLTAAVLMKEDVRQDIAITGTINSGGLVGPISGLRQKVEVAPKNNITKVLIPSGQVVIKEMNLSWNLAEYAEPLGAEVKEVVDIREAIGIATGKDFIKEEMNIEISEEYQKTMELLAVQLCNRTNEIKKEADAFDNKTKELKKSAFNLTKKAEKAVESEKFYSAASYCFSANVKYKSIAVKSEEIDFNSTSELIKQMNNNLEKIPVKTISDLQTYMVVKERLIEAEESFKEAIESYKNESEDWIYSYGYTIERLFSAEAWSQFFGKPGKEFVFNNEVLKQSCIDKIAEADERRQYVDLLIPNTFVEIKKVIDYAYEYMEKEDYEVCLYEASKAKSEADAIISLVGVDEDYMKILIDNKLNAVKGMIAEQQGPGIFPIVGYSYYEYADSLKEHDEGSALLYAEYALELSNLDLYFKEKHKRFRIDFGIKELLLLLIGIAIGLGISIVIKTLANPRRGLRGKKR